MSDQHEPIIKADQMSFLDVLVQQKERRTPSKYLIARHYGLKRNRGVTLRVPIIEDRPMCMACGWYDAFQAHSCREASESAPKRFKSWDKARYLERCHIVPFALTQDDSLDNLILMCKPCHADSPDTSSVRMFQKWITHRAHRDPLESLFADFHSGFSLYLSSVSDCQVERMFDADGNIVEDFFAFVSKQSGTHGNSRTPMTWCALVALFLDAKPNE